MIDDTNHILQSSYTRHLFLHQSYFKELLNQLKLNKFLAFGLFTHDTKMKKNENKIFSQSSNCKFLPYLLYLISKEEIYMIVGCFSRHRFDSKPTTNLKGIRALMRQVVHIIFNYTVN